MTLEKALALLALPRVIGPHPDDREPVLAGLGRFGPYVKHASTYRSIPADEDVTTIGLNRAVTLIAEAPARRGAAGKEIGVHPRDGKPITLHGGRYGPYVKHGKIIASLPKTAEPDSFSLDQAIELIAARVEKAGSKPAKKKAAKKKAAPKKKAVRKAS